MSGEQAADVEALRHMRAADPAAYKALMEKFKKEPVSPAGPKTPGPAATPATAPASASTSAWLSAVEALEAKNNNLDKVLGQLDVANQQAQGHLQHAFTRQQQMGKAILDLKKDSAEMKKAIETIKKQQVASVSAPSKSKISSLQSLSGGILSAQNSVPSDSSPFANY